MTSNRQYRNAIVFQRASEELDRSKGKQLDEKFVDAFLSLIQSPDFWIAAKSEIGESLPEQLLCDCKMYAGG